MVAAVIVLGAVPALAVVSSVGGAAFDVWRFLLIAIVLLSFACGLRGGLAGAFLATLVTALSHVAGAPDTDGWIAVLARSVNYVLAGAIVGWLVDSRARAVGALARHVQLSSDVIVSGADGRFDSVNDAFTRVLGHPLREAVGKPYLDFVHPEDRERSAAIERALVEGGGPVATFENRYRHLDGSYRWLEWSIVIDPRLRKGFAVGRDVTERKQAEQREREMLADLRRSLSRGRELEQQLTQVIETMLDALIEIDAAGTIVLFNRAAEELFGYRRDEVLGRNVKMLMPEPYRDGHDAYLARFHETRQPRIIGSGREVTGRRKDGSVFPLDLAVSETTVDGEQVFVGVIRDITERKLAEDRAQHYRQTLERAVRERTRELQERTVALEDARLETLQRLAMAGEYHDEDTYLHTDRVGAAAARIAEVYGAPRDFVRLIRLAAPLHDLGKIAVPTTVLQKRGELTVKQWEQVRSHPIVGAAILAGSTSEVLQLAEEIALTHHEWWDGSGYPSGLRRRDIPLSGRIVSLADTFDALTHDRPYKPAWSIERAVAEVRRLRGARFDPDVVDAFVRLDPARLTGEQASSPPAVPPHVRRRPGALLRGERRAGTGTAA